MLGTSVASVNSALQRAQKTVKNKLPAVSQAAELQSLGEGGLDKLLGAFVTAWESRDIDELVRLFTDAKLVFSHLVSLDGYCAGPDGDLSRLPMGPVFDDHSVALLRTAGTLVFGRITFGMSHAYWPQVEKDPSDGPVQAEIAALTRKIDKLVVSDTLAGSDIVMLRYACAAGA